MIYDNYTGNGVLGSVATLTAEMGYAALYMWQVIQITYPLNT